MNYSIVENNPWNTDIRCSAKRPEIRLELLFPAFCVCSS